MSHYIYVATNPALTKFYNDDGCALKIGYTSQGEVDNQIDRVIGLNGGKGINESKYGQYCKGKDILGNEDWIIRSENLVPAISKRWESIIKNRALDLGAIQIKGHKTKKGEKEHEAVELFLLPKGKKIMKPTNGNYMYMMTSADLKNIFETDTSGALQIDEFCEKVLNSDPNQ